MAHSFTYSHPDKIFISIHENLHFLVDLTNGKILSSRRKAEIALKSFTSKLKSNIHILTEKLILYNKFLFIKVPGTGYVIGDIIKRRVLFKGIEFSKAYEHWVRRVSSRRSRRTREESIVLKPWDLNASQKIAMTFTEKESQKVAKRFKGRYLWGEYYEENDIYSMSSLSGSDNADWNNLCEHNIFPRKNE
ncbi:MAG: hypothetical protein KDC73_10695 [Ignavibacteriae bacterium]|nr:hypothetical protein [Ignavibacteriota bacterium]MCB9242518.1 hypothetical protein [Ignavibacteriales bacterium]